MSDINSKKEEKPAFKMPDNCKVFETSTWLPKIAGNFCATEGVDFKIQDVKIQCSFVCEEEEVLKLIIVNKVAHFSNRPSLNHLIPNLIKQRPRHELKSGSADSYFVEVLKCLFLKSGY